jgi:regulator of sigma E protease
VFVIGETGIKPIVGKVESGTLAAEAGFVEQDEILSVNQKNTPTWMSALDELLSQALSGNHDIVINVKTFDGDQQMRVLIINEQDVQNPEALQKRLGLRPWAPIIKPIIGKLVAESVAEQAGLKSGDLIVSADGVAMQEWQQWVNYVQARPEQEIKLLIQRDEVQLPLTITPRKETLADGSVVGKIGAGVEVPQALLDSMVVNHSLSPLEAVPAAFERTAFYALSTVKMMGKMFVGSASVQNLSGPISIAQYAGQSAEMGLGAFLRFLALVSVSLGVLNLLPVPVLDGGHLLFYGIEAIKGSPVSDKVQLYFQQAGMLILFSLMALAMFVDLGRLFQ